MAPKDGEAPAAPAVRIDHSLRISYLDIDDLKPYERNARTHSAKQLEQIAASIREFGWSSPIIVDGQNGIIAGHGRAAAARLLGLKSVPVVRLEHLTPTQKRGLILAENKLAEAAGWDDGLLRAELAELRGLDFDLSLAGFSVTEVGRLFDEGVGASANEDSVPGLSEKAISRRGDIWLLGPHRIMCGDATSRTDVHSVTGSAKPNLMVTDPPYGVNYDPAWRARAGVNKNKNKMGKVSNDERADWREAWALFGGDVAYVWHAGLFASTVEESLRAAGFAMRSQIIWTKDRFALSRGDYHWQHEPCWYAVRAGSRSGWCGDRSQSTRWDIAAREDSGVGHGTQKPVECMRRPMLNNSKRGEHVYDPFVGSGTSLIAAQTCERACIGMDIDPRYVDVAIRRWREFVGKDAPPVYLEGTRDTFDDIAEKRTSANKSQDSAKPRKSRKPAST